MQAEQRSQALNAELRRCEQSLSMADGAHDAIEARLTTLHARHTAQALSSLHLTLSTHDETTRLKLTAAVAQWCRRALAVQQARPDRDTEFPEVWESRLAEEREGHAATMRRLEGQLRDAERRTDQPAVPAGRDAEERAVLLARLASAEEGLAGLEIENQKLTARLEARQRALDLANTPRVKDTVEAPEPFSATGFRVGELELEVGELKDQVSEARKACVRYSRRAGGAHRIAAGVSWARAAHKAWGWQRWFHNAALMRFERETNEELAALVASGSLNGTASVPPPAATAPVASPQGAHFGAALAVGCMLSGSRRGRLSVGLAVWRMATETLKHHREVAGVLAELKEKHAGYKAGKKRQTAVVESVASRHHHARAARRGLIWWRLWGAAVGQRRADAHRRLGGSLAAPPSASLAHRRQLAMHRLTSLAQPPATQAGTSGAWGSAGVRYLTTKSRAASLRITSRSLRPALAPVRRGVRLWATRASRAGESQRRLEDAGEARWRRACHSLQSAVREKASMADIVIERWHAAWRSSVRLIEAQAVLKAVLTAKHAEESSLKNRQAARVCHRAASSWASAALLGCFRAWGARLEARGREREAARTVLALTAERRSLEAEAAKGRLKHGQRGGSNSPMATTPRQARGGVTSEGRTRTPPGLKGAMASPKRRRLAIQAVARGVELTQLRQSGLAGAVWVWRKRMSVERETQGYRRQIKSLREEVNDAWIPF